MYSSPESWKQQTSGPGLPGTIALKTSRAQGVNGFIEKTAGKQENGKMCLCNLSIYITTINGPRGVGMGMGRWLLFIEFQFVFGVINETIICLVINIIFKTAGVGGSEEAAVMVLVSNQSNKHLQNANEAMALVIFGLIQNCVLYSKFEEEKGSHKKKFFLRNKELF